MRTEMSGGREREGDTLSRGSLLGEGAGSRTPLAVVVEEGSPYARQRPTPPRHRRGSRRPSAKDFSDPHPHDTQECC
jgi:hypothetical protein